jgi:hypothetical protein
MPFFTGLAGHNDSKHIGTAKRNVPGGVAGLDSNALLPLENLAGHNDSKHNGTAKRNGPGGVCGLNSSGKVDLAQLLTGVASGLPILDSNANIEAPGAKINLTRNGSDNIMMGEKTSGEDPFVLSRKGATDYIGYLLQGGANQKILTEADIAGNDPPGLAKVNGGSYTGDGVSNRRITTGFGNTPFVVMIYNYTDNIIFFQLYSSKVVCFDGTNFAYADRPSWQDNYFYVNPSSVEYKSTNTSGKRYYWVAIG